MMCGMADTTSIKALAALVARVGSQRGAAEVLGVSASFVSDMLRNKRRFSERILRKLGLQRVVVPK